LKLSVRRLLPEIFVLKYARMIKLHAERGWYFDFKNFKECEAPLIVLFV